MSEVIAALIGAAGAFIGIAWQRRQGPYVSVQQLLDERELLGRLPRHERELLQPVYEEHLFKYSQTDALKRSNSVTLTVALLAAGAILLMAAYIGLAAPAEDGRRALISSLDAASLGAAVLTALAVAFFTVFNVIDLVIHVRARRRWEARLKRE